VENGQQQKKQKKKKGKKGRPTKSRLHEIGEGITLLGQNIHISGGKKGETEKQVTFLRNLLRKKTT